MADYSEQGHPGSTAGIIIIGDEILKGHTKDTNSTYLLKKLWSLGVKVGKVSVVSDDVEDIAQEVHNFSSRFSFVITTGGIGPTHDDVTMQGIARAFQEDLVLNRELLKLISGACGGSDDHKHFNDSHLKMARVPSSVKLIYRQGKSNKLSTYPLVSARNVYIFPGVPPLLEKEFEVLEDLLRENKCHQFFLRKIYLSVGETSIAAVLNKVDDKFKGRVHLGSYPDFCNQDYKVKLTLESEQRSDLQEAWCYLLGELPKGAVVRTEQEDPDVSINDGPNSQNQSCSQVKALEKVYALLDPENESNTSACLKGAWAVIQQTLQLYSLDELCISFNGGKDCTVLLHILHAALHQQSPPPQQLKALYIQYDSPFPQAEDFIRDTTVRYNLNLTIMTGNIKEALKNLKKTQPKIRAILLGTRRHDPFSDVLRTFSPTDPDWPSYMRINPILDWHHADIWAVIQECNIPYCGLYDEGYTSLGSVHNTAPNPVLKYNDGSNKYKPAYMLEDGLLERAGRDK